MPVWFMVIQGIITDLPSNKKIEHYCYLARYLMSLEPGVLFEIDTNHFLVVVAGARMVETEA